MGDADRKSDTCTNKTIATPSLPSQIAQISLKPKLGLHGVEWVNLGGGGQFQALFDGPK
jgi:hypothetical protein